MIVSFFEEYPTQENLNKLKLITWPTKLYLATETEQEFLKLKKSIKNKYIKEFIWWPILKRKEGYWISPFSKRKALQRILQKTNTPLMLDLELPTTQNPTLYITQSLNFFRNKKLIKNYIKNNNCYCVEYYPNNKFMETFFKLIGIKYKNKHIIKMMYHSMHKFNESFVNAYIKKEKEKLGKHFIMAYGTLAKGEKGNEPILTKKQLDTDLRIAKQHQLQEVILYRLGGLNKEYVQIIKKHL